MKYTNQPPFSPAGLSEDHHNNNTDAEIHKDGANNSDSNQGSTNGGSDQRYKKKQSFKKAEGADYNNLGHNYVEHYDEHHEIHETRPSTAFAGMSVNDLEFYKSGLATITIKDKSAAPGALGLLGFGLTTFLLNLHNAGLYPMNSMILAMGICYGGLAQIIAGIFEFKRGNLFGMIAFMSYGFFWWSLILTIMLPKMGVATAADHPAMGCYLFIWGVFSFIMLMGTFVKRLPLALSWVFFTVVILFALLSARHFAESEELEKVAGVEGVICGLSAIILAAAELINDLGGRTIIPIGARSPK